MQTITGNVNSKYLYIINICAFFVVCLIGLKSSHLIGFGLVFLIILSVAFLLFILNKPHYGIILTVCGSMLGPLANLLSEEKAIPLSLFQVFLLFTLYLYIIYILRRGTFEFRIETPFRLVFVFIAFLLFTSLYSSNRGEALLMTTTLIILVIFSYMVSDLFRNARIFNRLFYTIIGFNIYHSIQAIYHYNVNPQAVYFNALSPVSQVFMRQAGSWGDPNKFGMMLVLPILFLICELLVTKKSLRSINKRDVLYLLILALFFSALLTTYSRSAWLSLAVGMITLFFLGKRTKRLFFIALVLGVVLIIVTLSNELFLKAIVKRISSIADVKTNTSNMIRIALAEGCIGMFKDSYFMGFGFRSSPVLMSNYIDLTRTLGIVYSHNLFLTMLAEIGIFGLLLFLSVVYSFVRQGLRLIALEEINERLRYYLVILLSYIFSLLVFYQFYPTGLHENLLWFCFGGIMAIKNIHHGTFSSSEHTGVPSVE